MEDVRYAPNKVTTTWGGGERLAAYFRFLNNRFLRSQCTYW